MRFKKRHPFKHKIFKNPPIIEALFEMRWKIWEKGEPPAAPMDEKFKFFPGRFYDKIKELFPNVEVLPYSNIPDQLDINLPRYRFRKSPNSYPLIQIGPGVLTVNLDKNFTQDLFFNTCIEILNIFFEILPDIKLRELILHYIDGFDYDYEKNDAFEFLDEKLSTHFAFSPNLFEDTNINPIPSKFHLEANYHVNDPKGYFMCQFRSGIRKPNGEKFILMDSIFRSFGDELPNIEEIDVWILRADDLIHKWFLKMIDKIKEMFK